MDSGTLLRSIGTELGVRAIGARPVSGGDVHQAWEVTLDDGRRLFAKTLVTVDDHDQMSATSRLDGAKAVTRSEAVLRFRTEADDLAALARPDAVAVPTVLALGRPEAPFLAMEWIDVGPVRPGGTSEEDFGRRLAVLHQHRAMTITHHGPEGATGHRPEGATGHRPEGATEHRPERATDQFGRSDGRPTGSRRLPNTLCTNWIEFYRTRRLLPLAELAEETGSLRTATLERLATVAANLDRWIPPDVSPSLLHGDLWAGNRLVDVDGRNWLIDPACFVGHYEFDLAMMRLFGGFGADCFAAHGEVMVPQDGWRQRTDLYQLAPLVVHAVKFAGPYPRAVDAALDRLL